MVLTELRGSVQLNRISIISNPADSSYIEFCRKISDILSRLLTDEGHSTHLLLVVVQRLHQTESLLKDFSIYSLDECK